MPYTHCSGTFSAAAATMKYVHRRIMELSCLGFSIWWKQVLISGRHFTHLCRALGYGSEWASLPSALSKCPCGVGNTAVTSVPVSCPTGRWLLGVCHPQHICLPFPEWHLLAFPLSMQCLTVSHLSWGGCGLCPDLRTSRICSGWDQDAGSEERPHHLLHSGGFLHMVHAAY